MVTSRSPLWRAALRTTASANWSSFTTWRITRSWLVSLVKLTVVLL